jgi:hypothetical protein
MRRFLNHVRAILATIIAAIILADMQPSAAAFDWRKQRRLWRQLLPT